MCPIDTIGVDEVDPQRVYGANSAIYGSAKHDNGIETGLQWWHTPVSRFQVWGNERRGETDADDGKADDSIELLIAFVRTLGPAWNAEFRQACGPSFLRNLDLRESG